MVMVFFCTRFFAGGIDLSETKCVMNSLRMCTPLKSFASLLLLLSVVAGSSARADLVRTQTITLHKGWNSVYLQVTPAIPNPAVVFSNTPISVAAIFLPTATPVEFIQNPGTIQWKKDGWAVWYAPNRPDAFLSSLHTINGNRAYLLYAKQDYVWQVTGAVVFEALKWKSSSFNVVGFSLDDQSPPTFDQFFSGSAAHQPYRIFRLVNDQWTLVANPVGTTMQTGEAFWIYCNGGSSYQGPLSVKVPLGQQLAFGTDSDAEVTIANQSPNPMYVRVDTVPGSLGLPMALMVRSVTATNMAELLFDLPAAYPMPALNPGAVTTLRLGVRREQMTQGSQSSLLKFSTDTGVQVWVPVTGTRPDLSATP